MKKKKLKKPYINYNNLFQENKYFGSDKKDSYLPLKTSERKLTNIIFQLINLTFKNIKSNPSQIKTLGLGKHIEWDSLGHM